MTTNERIRQLRKDLGLTQTEFGEKLGVSQDVIKNIEYNKTEPKDNFINLMCRVFGVSETWLRTGEGVMIPPRTEEEQIALALGKAMADKNAPVRLALIKIMAELSAEECEKIADFARQIAEAAKKEEAEE